MEKSAVTGRAKGGKKRAEILSPSERRAIAIKAAGARWGLKATHRGNFKEDFGVDVDCYVLDDDRKTAVISLRGIAKALGLSDNGTAFYRFLATKAMIETVGVELREKLANPLKFQSGTGGAGSPPPSVIFGFDATHLIDVCKAIVDAETSGRLRNHRAARQAHIILGASAKSGIKGLVYALAGYNPTAQEVIDAFKAYVQEEARKYEREFPNDLYVQWHRLYNIPRPERGKPWYFKNLTVKHVYHPLAKSNGKLYELLKALKAKDGDRQKKLFQFLNEIGARALRMQLGRVLEMSESSSDKFVYEAKIRERFGDQRELDFVPLPTSPSSEPAPLS